MTLSDNVIISDISGDISDISGDISDVSDTDPIDKDLVESENLAKETLIFGPIQITFKSSGSYKNDNIIFTKIKLLTQQLMQYH